MHSFASPRRHAAGRSWRGFAAASGGFTIIEILVVVAIIGILATIVAPRITRAMDNAKAQKCRNNLKQLHAAVLGYMADHGGDTPAAQSHELFNATNGKYSQSSSRGSPTTTLATSPSTPEARTAAPSWCATAKCGRWISRQ